MSQPAVLLSKACVKTKALLKRNSGPAQRADVANLKAFQQTVNSPQLGNQHVNLLSLISASLPEFQGTRETQG